MRDRRSAASVPSPIEPLETRRLLDGVAGYSAGSVNLADFNRLAGSGSEFGGAADVNYDGVVNLVDFHLLASNFGMSAAGSNPTPGDWENLVNSIPTFALDRAGTLFITGNRHNNQFVITSDTIAQQQALHPRTPIRRLHVDAGAGDDWIEMQVSLPATIIGARGHDRIIGGGRADHISGGAGNDTIDAGGGDDTVEGTAGHATITGSAGADLLLGGDDYDSLTGGSGDDTLRGGTFSDHCIGGDGNDLLYGDADGDMLYGGAGRDRYKCANGAVDWLYPDERPLDRILAADADDQIRWGWTPPLGGRVYIA